MSRYSLHIMGEIHDNSTIKLTKSIKIGRHPDNDLVLADGKISVYHAEIFIESNCLKIKDLDSRNGFLVNNKKEKETILKDGDIIKIVPFQIKVKDNQKEITISDTNIKLDKTLINLTETAQLSSELYKSEMSKLSDKKDNKGIIKEKHLLAIYKASNLISEVYEINELLENIIALFKDLLIVSNSVIFLKNKDNGELEAKSGKKLSISSTVLKKAIETQKGILSLNSQDDNRFNGAVSLVVNNISSIICVPLIHKNEILGAIYFDTRGMQKIFNKDDLALVVAVASTISSAIQNILYFERLNNSYNETMMALANAIELRDHYTVGHTHRVTEFAVQIAKILKWDRSRIDNVRRGGILHDVGKIAIDNAILSKPAKLTDDEFEQMKIHPIKGAEVIKEVSFLKDVTPYCLYHHEKYDGTGYPFGLAKNDIPIEGRLIAVADAFDAMTSNRPYRDGMPVEKAIKLIEEGKNTQFDPICADALIQANNEGKLDYIFQNRNNNENDVRCPFCSSYSKIPSNVLENDVFNCNICNRKLKLKKDAEIFVAELA